MIWILLALDSAMILVSMVVMVRILLALDDIKLAAEVVASDLWKAQRKVAGVASDLADSHLRADNAEGPYGAAGDAAARSSEG